MTAPGAGGAGNHPAVLHAFFDRVWSSCPAGVALDIPPGRDRSPRLRVTYADLHAASRRIADRLRSIATRDAIIALLLPRTSADAYAAMLGILRAGAAYTAIDPAYPDDRVAGILADAGARVLITDEAGAARAPRFGLDAASVWTTRDLARPDAPASPLAPADHAAGEDAVTPADLAYAIYTSGTTGRPKGVMIDHAAIANLVGADLDEFHLTPSDRIAQSSSHAYDSSIEEIWLAWAAGATLVVLDDDVVRSGPDLRTWLDREAITVFCPPPTLLRAMGCRDARDVPARLSLLYVGGEALPRDLADVWGRGCRLVNGYGPTECAVTAIRGIVASAGPITIGRPTRGIAAWILDEHLEPLPDGTIGELCLGGAGLARGYRHLPDLTAQKFPVHARLGRIYRTGDLAHREPDGAFYFHGRRDSQVKLRGHRIELEEIEARLTACAGVRAGACRVDAIGGSQRLVAYVVPADPTRPPVPAEVKADLARTLPAYMVPSAVAIIETLPTSSAGKLDRTALPPLPAWSGGVVTTGETARTPLEAIVASAVARILHHPDPVSIDDDFFDVLGADSLKAAELVTALREHPETSALTARDVYESPTVRALAARAAATATSLPAHAPAFSAAHDPRARASRGRPVIFTTLQALWLAGEVVAGSAVAAVVLVLGAPALLRAVGVLPALALAPLLVAALVVSYAAAGVVFAVAVKRAVIGTYVAARVPAWGREHLKIWIVDQAARTVPWSLFAGTDLQIAVLRALGARIGARVHLHRGVDLFAGGWDLLDIGDDATIGRDAAIHLVELDDGHVVVGPIAIGPEATVDVRAGVASHARIEAGGYLTALSALGSGMRIPQGERWDGVPAVPAGRAPARASLPLAARELSTAAFDVALIAAKLGVAVWLSLPTLVVLSALAGLHHADAASVLAWMTSPILDRSSVGVLAIVALVPIPLTIAMQAALARLLGSIPAGSIPRRSAAYVRVWIKTGLVESAGDWLSGALFWPAWLRAAGMTIAHGCEISSLVDVIPEHVDIGPGSFLTDGVYIGSPRVHRGAVTMAVTRLGAGVFVGNHAIIPAGRHPPDDVLVGVCTVADDPRMHAGSSWFGHPAFELHGRQSEASDRHLTHDPSAVRYANRLAWELLRFALPAVVLAADLTWFATIAGDATHFVTAATLLIVAPLVTVAVAAGLCLLVLILKWLLLARVAPGRHAFWSCWCSRWDFHYVAWERLARPALSRLEGTLLLGWFLRGMGVRLGKRVLLGSGFAHVVDPDMLEIDDDATMSGLLQAHTFEDRWLKIDRVRVGRGATVASDALLFYGSDVGEDAWVGPLSVVMKHERLPAGRRYEGCPTHPV